MASTYFTKLSSSLLFALIGGEVGASAFLPPVASTAPPMVTVRVAIASCGDVVSAGFDPRNSCKRKKARNSWT
jgi:hypothetical protein